MVPRALRETQTKEDHATFAGNIVRGVFVWLLLVGVVGLPYLDRIDSAPRSSPRQRIVAPACALSGALVHLRLNCRESFWKAFRMGYDTMPDKELKQRAWWDPYLLILSAIAMFIMAAHGLYFILVPLMMARY